MSNLTTNNQKENPVSIPIYFSNHFSSNKDILIGKVQNLQDKTSFKVTTQDTLIQGVKEYTLINDNDEYLQYSGKENVQDSNYVLMKYNSKDNEIQMYPANIWINFFKSTKKIKKDEKDDKDIKDKEKELKEQIKKNNKMMREHFNFDQELNEGDKKKKGILAFNEDEEAFKEEPKQTLKEFKEDSHSSELEMELGYDSFEFEDEEDKKKEDKKRKEEEKNKKEKKDDDDEEEEEEDEDDKDNDSYVSDEDDKKLFENFRSIGKKREREKNPGYELEEKMENLLRKKSRMTEDELINELKKECKKEDIGKYFETALENIADSFMGDDGEKMYYLKK